MHENDEKDVQLASQTASLDVSPKTFNEEERVLNSGPRAYMTVIGGFFIFMTTFGYNNAFGVYQDYFTTNNLSSASNVSWIGSLQVFLIIAIGIPAGKLLDAGYFRVTTAVGIVLYFVSLFTSSMVGPHRYWQVLLSQGIGMGLGGGLIYVPALAIQAHHWKRYMAPAMGIVISGSAIGGIVFTIMLNQLINGRVGFVWGVRISALVVLGLQVAAFCMMSPNRPARVGAAMFANLRVILTDVPFLIQSAGAFFIFFGVNFPSFYLQLFAIDHGVSQTAAFYVLVALNASSIPGRVLWSFLAKRSGVFPVYIPCCAACAVLSFALFGVSSTGSVFAFAILFGFFSGGYFSTYSITLTAFSLHESEISTRISIGYTISALGALIGTPIDGALLGTSFAWPNAIGCSSAAIIFGVGCSCVARLLLARRIAKAKAALVEKNVA